MNVRTSPMFQTELHLVGSMAGGMLAAPHQPAASGVASPALREFREETRQAGNGGTKTEGGGSMEEKSAAVAFVIPGAPVGKGRPRFARRGNFVSTYTDSKTASYENLVKVKAEEAMQGRILITGPVSIHIALFVTTPESWSQKKKRAALAGEIFPTTKPDWDNCGKGICDAINEIVFKDDKQVVDAHVTKRYADIARAFVKVVAL